MEFFSFCWSGSSVHYSWSSTAPPWPQTQCSASWETFTLLRSALIVAVGILDPSWGSHLNLKPWQWITTSQPGREKDTKHHRWRCVCYFQWSSWLIWFFGTIYFQFRFYHQQSQWHLEMCYWEWQYYCRWHHSPPYNNPPHTFIVADLLSLKTMRDGICVVNTFDRM